LPWRSAQRCLLVALQCQLALELKQNLLDSPFQCGISALLKSLPDH
jgi:hypothetical protein